MAPLGLVPRSVGLGYGVCYDPRLLEDSSRPIGRLVFEAVLRPSCGSGKLIFTGGHDNAQLACMAAMAFEWAMANQEGIEEELGRRQGLRLSRYRDVHLHLRNAVANMVVAPFYCPAMGVALASLLSGRLPLEDVAVSGDLTVLDEFLGTVPPFGHVEHVKYLYDQGFRRLLVGYEPPRGQQQDDVLAEVARRGISVEVPPGNDVTFVSALIKVFGLQH